MLRQCFRRGKTNDKLRDMTETIKASKSVSDVDNTYVEYYCTGRFTDLKDYFKHIKVKEVSYHDLNILLKSVPVTHLLLLRQFILHMKQHKELIDSTGFWYNYY